MTYYAAYCCDLGRDVPIEAAVSKMYATDEALNITSESIQIMGGNGAMRFYPVERLMRDAKVSQIAAGTNEVLRLLIYRMGTKEMKDDLKAPRRMVDPELKVPMPAGKAVPRKKAINETDVQAVLAENYRINPGLHMTLEDIKEELEIDDTDLNKYLQSLEGKGSIKLYRDKRGTVTMARITFEGLSEANPPEYYRYIPSWVNIKDVF